MTVTAKFNPTNIENVLEKIPGMPRKLLDLSLSHAAGMQIALLLLPVRDRFLWSFPDRRDSHEERYDMEGLLKGKIAVVTGGTRGIGYAIVKKYLEAGASVVLCGSREATAKEALARVRSELPGAEVDAIWPDLTDAGSVFSAFSKVAEKYGRIDILANNAGISQRTSLYDYTEKEFDDILSLNVKAVFNCAQAAARIMKGKGGAIVNTSSVVSLYGQPSGCGYPASKFAVNGLTKSLARELAKDGIRVNAVAPGVIRTDMVAKLPEEMIKPIVDNIPIGRMGEPEDIANAYVFLSSDYASYITGAILSVDGGVII